MSRWGSLDIGSLKQNAMTPLRTIGQQGVSALRLKPLIVWEEFFEFHRPVLQFRAAALPLTVESQGEVAEQASEGEMAAVSFLAVRGN